MTDHALTDDDLAQLRALSEAKRRERDAEVAKAQPPEATTDVRDARLAPAATPDLAAQFFARIGDRMAKSAPPGVDDDSGRSWLHVQERIAGARLRAALRLVELTIPEARRWAKLDASELAGRVRSAEAVAATRKAVDASSVVWRGPSGFGKTSLACAALRAAVEAGRSSRPMFVAAWRLAVARSRHPLGEGEPRIVEDAMRADLLVIDDLGSEQAMPTSAVADVVCDREERDAATWFTTWMDPAQVAQRYGDGIARRVFERALVITC